MPQIFDYEKMILLENFRNPYQNALFSMMIAQAKTEKGDQRSLLLESLNYIGKAKKSEEDIESRIVENSALFKPIDFLPVSDNDKKESKVSSHYRYTRKSHVPPAPIILARTTTSIIVKLPFFKPITDFKSWRIIDKLIVFCKEIETDEAVTLKDHDYPGTGEKYSEGSIVTIRDLAPNKSYKFACGGYTTDNVCVNGIGTETHPVVPLLSLNINVLYGYLAQTAFKLEHFQISKKSAESLLTDFIERHYQK